MAYVAYLRVYEPLAAFHEPERSRWTAYAEGTARPRRQDALRAEQAESLRRVISGVEVPEQESCHAYVRRLAGTAYLCPWQLRLRCLLAAGALPGPAGRPSARPHIHSRGWRVPLAWFVLFGGEERWMALGSGARVSVPGTVRATAQAGRALLYTTPMSRARQRLSRGLVAVRSASPAHGPERLSLEADLADLACWLERFHPGSLVELDYGGLVYLFTDDGLRGDESVAEVAAALEGMVRGRREVAAGMLARVIARWARFRAFEQVN